MVGRHLVDSQKIAVRYIGRESADSRLIYRSRFLSVCIVFSPLSIALEKKLEQDYWNINRLPPLTHGDSWKIRIFGHFSVSYESKLLKIKHESMPFFAVASRFVTFFGTGIPNLFRLFCFFFRFSFFSCFCHFAAVANCQSPANCQLPVHSRIFEKASSKREILPKWWRWKFFLRFLHSNL